MKRSKLQQIIKEEIQNILHEEDPLQTAFDKKVGTPEPSSGAKNVMRSKEWMEGYRAYIPGKSTYAQPKNPYTEPESFEDRLNRSDSYAEKSVKLKQWSEGFKAAYDKDPNKFTPKSSQDKGISQYYKDTKRGFTGD
jgi:hypothetical protein